MNQFVLRQHIAPELKLFPHILEIGVVKNSAIHLHGFPCAAENCLRFYFIQDGKFEWKIEGRNYTLFPGDVALVQPGAAFGSPDDVLEIGTFLWLYLQVNRNEECTLATGSWSGLSAAENIAICKMLQRDHTPVLHKCQEAGVILRSIQAELFNKDIGFETRVNHLLDDLLIQLARRCTTISNPGRDFPKTFMALEQELRKNLSHQWTVDEMAGFVGLGTTLFNEKVKSYSGFSPLSYLINIRISEAMKLLKRPDVSLTDIAFDTGFYSSQHFSTTFKKLTGYTPSQFRKNHSRTK
ncbi:MAG: AraC family transcriptional regulator [Chitinophagaceae bacterium]